MLVLSELNALLGIVDKAQSWLSQVFAQRKNREEQQAANLLAAAGILVAAMRTLDNSLRAITSELNLFTPEWPQERREELVQRMNAFANDEKILPVVRQYSEQLERLLPNAQAGDEEDARAVLECARGILAALGDSPVTPFPDTTALRAFLMLIKQASTPEDVKMAIEQSDSVVALVGRDVLRRADLAFGRLKGRILQRHQKLPKPSWFDE